MTDKEDRNRFVLAIQEINDLLKETDKQEDEAFILSAKMADECWEEIKFDDKICRNSTLVGLTHAEAFSPQSIIQKFLLRFLEKCRKM